MIHILTNTSTILHVEVRPQESRKGDSNVKAVLNLKLKSTLTKDSFSEQQSHLKASATAAYVSLNKLDQRTRFRASVNLKACNDQEFNFTQGSSSSGLGYALACFDAWWRLRLNKNSQFNVPVFTTGEVLTSGQIKPIGHIHEKIVSLCRHIEENRNSISTFYFCYPAANDEEITNQLKDRLTNLGGKLIPSERLQQTLAALLGDSYDGDPLGRWLPFKGLNSFEYEDSVRFFGRDKDVDRIASDIKHNSGLLIVSGASGTGKSSLIKAGLIPKLEKEFGALCWATSTPAALTYSQGILSFTIETLSQAWNIPNEKLSEILLSLNQSVEGGIAYIKSYLNESSLNCLVYIDQFEEVFSQNEQEANLIANELALVDSLAKSLGPLNLVLAIRNEYLGRLLDSQALRSPIVSNVASQLTSQEWQSIVHEQALFSGITFEQKDNGILPLDRLIVEEAIQVPFALPMVSFLLEQLYLKASEEKQSSTTLRYQHFKELGGLNGAIAYRASKVIEDNNFSNDVVLKFFDCFVGINPEGLPFARHVSLFDIEINDKALYALVIAFNDSNLVLNVTTNIDEPKVKLAHDSLFSNWIELSQWIEKSKEYLLWRYSIDGLFVRWQKAQKNRNAYYLKDKKLLQEGKTYQKLSLIFDKQLNNYLNLSLKNRSHKHLSFFLIFLMLPALIVGGYLWDKNRIKSYYYSAIGEKWSVPYGINELTEEQVKHRTFSYRLDYQGGILKRLAHVNSHNTLSVDESRSNAALWEYKFVTDGTIQSVIAKDSANKVAQVTNYQFNGSTQAIADFSLKFGKKNFNQVTKNLQFLPFYKPENPKINFTNSEVSQHFLTYSKMGLLIKEEFQNPYGTKKSIKNSYYGNKYKYNKNGLVEAEIYIDQHGQITRGKRGIHHIRYSYDSFGNVIKEQLSSGGVIQFNFDNWGNKVEKNYRDNTGQLTSVNGIATTRHDLDPRGSIIKSSIFNVQGQLYESPFGIAIKEMEYNDIGRVSKVSFYNSASERVKNKEGYAQQTVKYDSKGNIIEISNYGVDEKLTANVLGCSVVKLTYNENSEVLRRDCINEKEELTLDSQKVARYDSAYNNLGFIKQVLMIGVTEELTINKDGYAKVVFKKNRKGETLSESYFGVDNKPIRVKGNAVKNTYKYDGKGNIVEQSFWNEEGKRGLIDGVATLVNVYDDLGRLTQTYYLDEMNEPTLHQGMKYHKKITEFSEKGDYISSINHYDEKGNILDVISRQVENNKYPVKFQNIKINSNPEGAKVFIDNKYVGVTPFYKSVMPGTHNILVTKQGFSEVKNTIVAIAGHVTSSTFNLPTLPKPEKIDIKAIEKKAIQGYSESQFLLGNYYSKLTNTEEGNSIGESWYKKSSENGHSRAMYQLGTKYLKDKHKIEKGIYWLKLSANNGNKEAQVELGNEYFTGTNIGQDDPKALKYYVMAALQGYSRAQYQLGRIYLYGWGQEKDIEKAYEWLLLAANAGYEQSFLHLGNLYDSQKWAGYHPEKAFYWYMLSAELAEPEAYFKVGVAYMDGKGVNANTNKAVSWLMKAYQSEDRVNSSYAAGMLGAIYGYGLGISTDFEKAVSFYQDSIAGGDWSSMTPLAYMYLQGYGVEVNYAKAVELFKLAHSKGNKGATRWLTKYGEL